MQCRKRRCAWFIGVMFRRREKVGVGRFLSFVVNGWSSVLVMRTLVDHPDYEEEICRALIFCCRAASAKTFRDGRRLGYRTLHSSEGMTPTVQTPHGRRRRSSGVPRREGKRQRIALFVQFSDLDEEVIEPVGEQAELFHLDARGIEEAPM